METFKVPIIKAEYAKTVFGGDFPTEHNSMTNYDIWFALISHLLFLSPAANQPTQIYLLLIHKKSKKVLNTIIFIDMTRHCHVTLENKFENESFIKNVHQK